MSKTKTIDSSTKLATPVKKTSTKKTKDPNAPKRFRTAYILFSVEKRNQIKSENPGLSAKEIVAELGAQWKAADAATKQRFQKLSDTEKSEYEEKMSAYKGDKDSTAKQTSKKNKSSKQQEATTNGNDESMED